MSSFHGGHNSKGETLTRTFSKSTLFVGAALSLCFAAPAFSQPKQTTTPTVAGGGDVIVTARRIEERLQDVPISITVYNQEQLDNSNIVSVKDLATFTPGLTANNRFGSENSSYSIRGFFQEQFTAPSVAMYFADAVAPRGASSIQAGDGAGPGSYFDLQNVQVLKGPQGTLFGRNTTGGAILLVPVKPRREFEGYGEVSLGNYDMRRLQAVVNLPLNDNIRLRLGVDRLKRAGYLKNISGVGPRRMADQNYLALRGSLVVDVTPELENYTVGTYARSDTYGQIPRTVACVPTVTLGGIYPSGAQACAQIARETAAGGFYTVSNATPHPQQYLRQWQIINTTTWRVSDNLTVKNVFSYGELRNRYREDTFGNFWSVIPPATVALGRPFTQSAVNDSDDSPGNNQSTLTEEIQVQGAALDGRLDWQTGLYFESSRSPSITGFTSAVLLVCTDVLTFQCVSPYGNLGSISVSRSTNGFNDWGAYAQGSYNLTDKLRFTAGIRYSDNRAKNIDTSRTLRLNAAGAITATTCNNPGAVLPTCYTATSTRSNAPTWLLNLDYKPIDSTLLYVKNARG
jgi:iron complex outermembrane receptor protein